MTCDTLPHAAELAIPSKMLKVRTNTKPKRWNEEIKRFKQLSKQTDYEFKSEG